MINNKLFPWQLAQLRKRIMDPIAEYWKDWREAWEQGFKP